MRALPFPFLPPSSCVAATAAAEATTAAAAVEIAVSSTLPPSSLLPYSSHPSSYLFFLSSCRTVRICSCVRINTRAATHAAAPSSSPNSDRIKAGLLLRLQTHLKRRRGRSHQTRALLLLFFLQLELRRED